MDLLSVNTRRQLVSRFEVPETNIVIASDNKNLTAFKYREEI